MKKFRVRVERVDEYVVEFDEKYFDEEFMEHYKKYFQDFDTLKEHAEHIAQFRARLGDEFIEGYGLPRINGKLPFAAQINEDFIKQVNPGLNINIISEDNVNNMRIDAEEIREDDINSGSK